MFLFVGALGRTPRLSVPQVVNVEYANGATASLTMAAFTQSECFRKTVIHGSRGELIGNMETFVSVGSGTQW